MRMIHVSTRFEDGDELHAWTAPGSSTVTYNFGANISGRLIWGDLETASHNPASKLANTVRRDWRVIGPVIEWH